MSEWTGVLYLLGAVVGYVFFLGAHPHRWAFGRAYRVLRDYPLLWLVVAVFATVRVTIDTVARLADGAITPDEFVRVVPPGVLPLGHDLAGPALAATLHSFLRLPTLMMDAWPVSLVMAVCLLVNGGNSLKGLWEAPEGKGVVWRWLFTIIVVAAAILHLAQSLFRVLPEALLARIPQLPEMVPVILSWGGEFFVVVCALAIQIWVVNWVAHLGEGIYEEAFLQSVIGKLGGVFLLACIYTAARMLWREGWEPPVSEQVVFAAGGVAGLGIVASQVCYLRGERGFLFSLATRGFWPVMRLSRSLWWVLAAALNLFLLHLCETGMDAWVGDETWVAWCWHVFYAFLSSGISVWLLSALVILIAEEPAGDAGASGAGAGV